MQFARPDRIVSATVRSHRREDRYFLSLFYAVISIGNLSFYFLLKYCKRKRNVRVHERVHEDPFKLY